MPMDDAKRTVSQEQFIPSTAFFYPMPLITSVTGINPDKMSHLQSEGYELHFYRHVKNKGLYSQIQGYFN